METLTIELKKDKSMALLEDLEALDIIKIIRKKTPPKPPGKLSDMFRGSISIEEGERLKKHSQEIRDEWERDF
jgi:hypothetical protein